MSRVDIILVSGRARGDEPHPSRVEADRMARELALAGHRVRWLCPVRRNGGGPAVHLPEAATFIPVVSRVAPSRGVEKRIVDNPTDRALAQEIRRRLPDVVHVLAFGGVHSAITVWLADRLGAPTVATVDPREVLCHRGTLVNERGEACSEWNLPERCAACCTSPGGDGLDPNDGRWGRRLRFLGRWSPYPNSIDFENRLDTVIGGLLPANTILVHDETEREQLIAAGLLARGIRVVADDIEQVAAIYAEVAQESVSAAL